MGGTRVVALLRRTLVASVVAVIGLALAAPIASADPCPPLDLGCVLDDTTTTVGGVLDDTTTTVGGVVDDTTTTVGGVVDDTTTTIDPGTIPGRVVPGGSGVGVLPGTEDTPSGGSTSPPSGGGSTPGEGTHTGRPSSGSQAEPTVVPAGGIRAGVVSAPAGVASTAVGHPFPAFLDDASGGTLLSGARLVRTLAFPVALVVLVIGFAVVQDRIDRKDPKLVLAPVGSDYLTFS